MVRVLPCLLAKIEYLVIDILYIFIVLLAGRILLVAHQLGAGLGLSDSYLSNFSAGSLGCRARFMSEQHSSRYLAWTQQRLENFAGKGFPS